MNQQAIDFIMTFKNWIAGGSITLCIWFIIHFIKTREKFEDKIDKFKDGVGEKLATALDKIDKSAVEFAKQIEHARTLTNTVTQRTYDLQETLIRDITRIQIEVSAVSSQLRNVESQTTTVSEKMTSLYTQVDELQKTVTAHKHSLSLGAQAFHVQKEALANMKSEIVKISQEVMLIKTVNKKQ